MDNWRCSHGWLRGEQCEICNAPKRQWVGLTDEEIFRADPRIGTSDSNVNPYQILINARAIEAMLKKKNYG